MDCRQIDRLLEANIDGRLSGFERMALRQHVKSCRTCRAKVEAMTAFSASVEKALAGAESPDWRRLTPPVGGSDAAAPTVPRPNPSPARPPARPPQPRAARRKSWSSLGVAVAGAAVIAVVVPFWTPPRPHPAPTAWLEEVIAAEATRQAGGGRLDLVTDDPQRATAWFGGRGLPPLPSLDLPAGVQLEGAFLDYYDGTRVAGLVLRAPAGRLTLHLKPHAAGAAGADASAETDGLRAVAADAAGWRAAAVGRPEAMTGSAVAGWLPAALVAAGG